MCPIKFSIISDKVTQQNYEFSWKYSLFLFAKISSTDTVYT